MHRYLTFGYASLLVGGLVVAAGGLIYAAVYGSPFSAVVPTGGFVLGAAIRLIGLIGVMVGMPALVACQAERAGAWAGAVLLGVTAWLALWAGILFTDLFVSGALSAADPGLVDGTTSNDRLALGFLLAFFGVVSLLPLGIMTVRSRVLPRAAGWVLIGTGVVALVPLPVSVPVADIELGLLLAVVGLLALRSRAGDPVAARESVDVLEH